MRRRAAALTRARARLLLRTRDRPAPAINLPKAKRHTRTPSDEPIAAVYFAAGRNNAVDDRHSVGRLRRVSRAADFRAAAGRLPHDSGADVLPRRQPGRDDVVGDGAARAAGWTDPR